MSNIKGDQKGTSTLKAKSIDFDFGNDVRVKFTENLTEIASKEHSRSGHAGRLFFYKVDVQVGPESVSFLTFMSATETQAIQFVKHVTHPTVEIRRTKSVNEL